MSFQSIPNSPWQDGQQDEQQQQQSDQQPSQEQSQISPRSTSNFNILSGYPIFPNDNPYPFRNVGPDATSMPSLGSVSMQQFYTTNDVNFGEYRSVALPSDQGTIPEDSGFFERSHHRSPSNDGNASLISGRVGDRSPNLEARQTEDMFQSLRVGASSRRGSRSVRSGRSAIVKTEAKSYHCIRCSVTVKTLSEFKKHNQRHNKEHRCDYPGCERKEGFSTPNDLARHKKSVHREEGHGHTFVCHHDNCKLPENFKAWPRADNFRNHLKRLHHVEITAEADLSKYYYNPPPTVEQQPPGNDVNEDFMDSMAAIEEVPNQENELTGVGQGTATGFLQDESSLLQSAPQIRLEDLVMTSSSPANGNDQLESSAMVRDQSQLFLPHGNTLESLTEDGAESQFFTPALLYDYYGNGSSTMYDENANLTPAAFDDINLSSLSTLHTTDSMGDAMMSFTTSTQLSTNQTSVMTTQIQNDYTENGVQDGHLEQNDDNSDNEDDEDDEDEDDNNDNEEDDEEDDDEEEDIKEEMQIVNADNDNDNDDDDDDDETKDVDAEHEDDSEQIMVTPKLEIDIDNLPTYETLSEQGMTEMQIIDYLRKFPKCILESACTAKAEDEASDNGNVIPCPTKGSIQCPRCSKIFVRPSELKKHMKRHDKPYGCTFLCCKDKRFGSKNDWKRHENGQHQNLNHHIQVWQCNLSGCSAEFHASIEAFKTHACKRHGIMDINQFRALADQCSVGGQQDRRFWCGFCVKVVDGGECGASSGISAWASRCDHIDLHFSGKNGFEQKLIGEWKYLEDQPGMETHQTISPPDNGNVNNKAQQAAASSSSPSSAGFNNGFSANTDDTLESHRKRKGGTPTARPPKRSGKHRQS